MAADLRRALFSEMAMVQVGMLGVQGGDTPPLPLCPMVHLMAPRSPDLWFLATPDSDLVKAVDLSVQGAYCVTGRNHDLYACLTGPIRQVPDRRGLDRVWSVMAESLFPGGLSDIEWTVLHLRAVEARVWATPESAIVTGMEVILPTLRSEGITEATEAVFRF